MSILYPIKHLAIDIQDQDVLKLNPERQKSFPKKIQGFAAALRRLNIPTIWIAFRDSPAFYPRLGPWSLADGEKRDRDLLDKLGFSDVAIGSDEEIFVKAEPMAFHYGDYEGAFDNHPSFWGVEAPLACHLRSYQTQTVILSGINTAGCVLETFLSGFPYGFKTIIPTDMLAQSLPDCHEGDHADDHLWHRNQIESRIAFERLKDFLELTTSGTVLDRFKKEPAPPVKGTPALISPIKALT